MDAMEFSALRYGLFIHFGLYSLQGRGEWVMNREKIPPAAMREIAGGFRPDSFDADEICRLAVDGGMKYIVFTTMHHDGFRLYDTALTDYNAQRICGRDFVSEIVDAARRHNLGTGLYHSLNCWYDQPDSVAALENPRDYEVFIANTFARLKELARLFNPIDILWYDGWWPFNAEQWRAEAMNREMRAIQPHLLFNGRNCLPGDFGTPEGHITAPAPWRPWEACMTLNDHWGFHPADHNWKSPVELVKMLLKCAEGRGNLLLNVGPDGQGAVPAASADIIRKVGRWLRDGGDELMAGLEPMPYGPLLRQPGDRGDWDGAGPLVAAGDMLYQVLLYPPRRVHTLTGLEMEVLSVSTRKHGELPFTQEADKIAIELPATLADDFAPVLRCRCRGKPSIYRTGGMRVPNVEHPRYDPITPDIQYE